MYYGIIDISKVVIIMRLKKITAKNGKYAVLGNHDYEPEGLIKHILEQSNFIVLEDEFLNLEKNVTLYGVKDLWVHGNDKSKLNSINKNLTILLSHNPDIFSSSKTFAKLTIAGHTHGGEVYFPIIGAPYVPSKYKNRYRKGIIKEDNKILFVSSGIATLSGFRLFNIPEIAVLKF